MAFVCFVIFLTVFFVKVVVENPLVANKDPEKEEKFCPTTPR